MKFVDEIDNISSRGDNCFFLNSNTFLWGYFKNHRNRANISCYSIYYFTISVNSILFKTKKYLIIFPI